MVVLWLIVPLFPVTVTVKDPLLSDEGTVMVSVEVPEFVIVVGLKVAVTPLRDALAVRETAPVNPFSAPIVIVDFPVDPLLMLMLLGEAEIEKSGLATITVTVVLWISWLLLVSVAVTVTAYVPPAVPEGTFTVSVEVPGVAVATLTGVVIDAHVAGIS